MIDLDGPGFLRMVQIIGDKQHDKAIIPVSRDLWLRGIRAGIFPKPVKLSARTVCWRKSDIKALVERLSNQVAANED
jgi:prophage regulatory protein